MDNTYCAIHRILPEKIEHFINRHKLIEKTEEIRMRSQRPLEIHTFDERITTDIICSREEIEQTLNRCAEYSLFAYENEIRQGYLTLEGGHRVGFCGKAVHTGQTLTSIRYFSSLNIRLAREKKGCAKEFIPYLLDGERPLSTLLLSAPKVGKTTLLRDIARILSNGEEFGPGYKVAIVDERSEIASSKCGQAMLDVGIRSDVFDACPKACAMMILIRSMSPEIIITDEIGGKDDFYAILNAMQSGVCVIASAHAGSMEELKNRIMMKDILESGFFSRYIVLKRENSRIFPLHIYNRNFEEIRP